jgi:hypothetical protein
MVRPRMQATAITRSRWLPITAKAVGGVAALYVLVYSCLSLFGSYRPLLMASAGVTEYSVWAPLGFFDPEHSLSGSIVTDGVGTWRGSLIPVIFNPLWELDIAYVHRTKLPR